MADDNTYAIFKPLAQEITFDVDMSNLPCGIAADIHFAEMAADGGMAESSGWNTAGAKYGTGYCGARCPRDVKFVQGHDDCGASASSGSTYNGVCDPDGCDFNPYRMGNPSFYGSGKTIDTTEKFTVVAQFITDNGTPTGSLLEIRRKYIQNGVPITNSYVNVPGVNPSFNSITSNYCDQQKAAFLDMFSFQDRGGLSSVGDALKRGMVLVLSIYDDRDANMLWLDGQYPPGADPSIPGVARGTCATTSGVPADVEAMFPTSSVTISNIKFGPIGSTA
ncbi:hypothetical protein FS837_011486 [Tulasnella sp. UAMH 9824]|nr:hypothetical protein FS837_011486 [Tulasnella sp. UAMH 9824]